MKLIVGLGNPGLQYEFTRHNIGFLILDNLAAKTRMSLFSKAGSALIGKRRIAGYEAVVAKPLTYMNNSGEAVGILSAHFSIDPEDIIIIHDDIDLNFGKLKIKSKGGSAGHRGVESIISHLHTDTFFRIRVGVGQPTDEHTAKDYVLNTFNKEEQTTLKEVIERTVTCLETLLKRGPSAAMNLFHGMGPAHSK